MQFSYFRLARSKPLKHKFLASFSQYLSNYQPIAMLLHLNNTAITRQKQCFYLHPTNKKDFVR